MERSRFLSRQGRKLFRSDVHMNGRRSSISGFFEFKLDNAAGKDLAGTPTISANEKETKLDAAFNVTLK